MEDDINEYINNISKDLVKKMFNLDININLDICNSFLNDKRIKEIDKYRIYELISPQIYNLCYLLLTSELNMEKKFIISKMETEVNKNKLEMRKISILRYTPTEYIETKKREKELSAVERHPSKKDGINWDVDEFERADFSPWRI